MSEKISDLLAKRGEYLAAVSEIDSQLKRAFHALGIDPGEFGISDGGTRSPRLPSPNQYPLAPNTMGAHMVNILTKADNGYSRLALRKEIEKEPRYAAQIAKNVNGYYNLINRYLSKGRIKDVGGLIYHPDRAPLPDGQEDPTGQHLPQNVQSLFGSERK